MNYVTLPGYGTCNIDTIKAVRMAPANWHHRNERHAGRPWIWWGKPYRSNGASFGAWFEKAEVRIYWSGGDGYPTCIQCRNNKAAQALCEDIEAAIRNAREHGPERIVAAAIRRRELDQASGGVGEHWVTRTMEPPARHHHILHHTMGRAALTSEQGFLTSTGRFVSRTEAMGLAVAAGQVSPSKVQSPDLFSEDLW